MKKVLLILSLFLVHLSSAAESILLGSALTQDSIFPYGSGYGADRYFLSPVADDGSVLLIAADPVNIPQSNDTFYFAVYHCPFQDGSQTEPYQLFPGYFSLPEYNIEFAYPNWQIAADAAFTKCLTIREEESGTVLNPVYLRHKKLPVRADAEIPNVQTAKYVKLVMNAAGNLAITYGGQSTPILYDIDDQGVTLRAGLELNQLKVKFVSGKKEDKVSFSFDDADQMALSDSGKLFFAETGAQALGALVKLGNDQRGIFVLDLDSLIVKFIGNAGAAKSHLSQLSLSADGETLVYRRSSNWLQLAQYNQASDTYSISRLVLEKVLNPMLSANGRYIVFESTESDLTDDSDGTRQIYRYDLKLKEYLLISSINGNVANNSCHCPAISPNGRMVTFVSTATNLVAGLDGVQRQVFLADAGEEVLESRSAGELREGAELTWLRVNELGILALQESKQGVWLNRQGDPATLAPLQEQDFPLTFAANDDVFGRTVVSLRSDSYRYELTILLDAMQTNVLLRAGWQLLSFPFVPDASSVEKILSQTTMFAWDTEKCFFVQQHTSEQLQQAGIGFFVYSESGANLAISGTRVDINSIFPFVPGWQLRGNVGDGDVLNVYSGGLLFQFDKKQLFLLPSTASLPENAAGWFFQP